MILRFIKSSLCELAICSCIYCIIAPTLFTSVDMEVQQAR